jgi:hypothetical protein
MLIWTFKLVQKYPRPKFAFWICLQFNFEAKCFKIISKLNNIEVKHLLVQRMLIAKQTVMNWSKINNILAKHLRPVKKFTNFQTYALSKKYTFTL